MIGIILQRADEFVKVVVDGSNVYFQTNPSDNRMFPIEALRLDKNGVVKELPHLKDSPTWHEQAMQVLKDKIKAMKSEDEICLYVQVELTKFGYTPLYKQKNGFRPEKIR